MHSSKIPYFSNDLRDPDQHTYVLPSPKFAVARDQTELPSHVRPEPHNSSGEDCESIAIMPCRDFVLKCTIDPRFTFQLPLSSGELFPRSLPLFHPIAQRNAALNSAKAASKSKQETKCSGSHPIICDIAINLSQLRRYEA